MKNLFLPILFLALPLLGKGQETDSLKNLYVDYTRGYIRISSYVGIKDSYVASKILLGTNAEVLLDLKNPHFAIGAKAMLYRKIDPIFFDVKNKFDVGFATIGYSPFLNQNLILIGGIGLDSHSNPASTYTARYLIDSLWHRPISINFESSLTLMKNNMDYSVLTFVGSHGYFIGGYLSNNMVNGLCFGAYEQWMMLQFTVRRDRIEEQNFYSGTCQLELRFPLMRREPKLIYIYK